MILKIKKRNFLKVAITITILLTLVIPSSSTITDLQEKTNMNSVLTDKKYIQNKGQEMEIQGYEQMPEGYRLVGSKGSISITDWLPEDSKLPSVTTDYDGHTIITWTYERDESNWDLGIAFSDNPSNPSSWSGYAIYFYTWSKGTYYNTVRTQGPDPYNFKGLYGTFITLGDPLYMGNYLIEDITSDFVTWQFIVFVAPWYLDPKYARSADNGWYYAPSQNVEGPNNIYIHHFLEGIFDIPDCPSLTYFDPYLQDLGLYFDGQSEITTAPASDPDLVNLPDRFHITWQYHDENLDIDKIVWKKIDPELQADIEYTPYYQYISNGSHPAIAAYDPGYVAIVYMDAGAINCAYSIDDGENWTITQVTAQGTYPDIYAAGEKLFCSYITDGNLYLVNSTDGGATWSTPVQINDMDGTVVEEENSVDINVGGVVWTDNRNGVKDIYYLDAGISPSLFIRGDVKQDGEITIGDAMYILKHLYVPGWPEPPCLDTVDVNDDGTLSTDDAIYLMRHQYIPNAPQPPEPFPNCGPDPTPDTINCACHPCMNMDCS